MTPRMGRRRCRGCRRRRRGRDRLPCGGSILPYRPASGPESGRPVGSTTLPGRRWHPPGADIAEPIHAHNNSRLPETGPASRVDEIGHGVVRRLVGEPRTPAGAASAPGNAHSVGIGATLSAPRRHGRRASTELPMTTISTTSSTSSPTSTAETQDWVESFDQVLDQEGENRARFLMYKLLKRARQRHVGLPQPDADPVHQHDQPGAGALLPGRRGAGAPDPAADPLERGGDGPPGEQPLPGHRRAPLDVRLRGEPVRGRLQPLLPGQGPPGRRRPGLLPGPRGAGHLRPRVPRGPADRGAAGPLPARDEPARG